MPHLTKHLQADYGNSPAFVVDELIETFPLTAACELGFLTDKEHIYMFYLFVCLIYPEIHLYRDPSPNLCGQPSV